eukprot:GGOE01027996.1.p1 GENE.GGOE01027996.1~~GGOE01027996.1.p1  ORF type:complete len:103 (-),score=9.90 GGOE01027996.1:41-349(-)
MHVAVDPTQRFQALASSHFPQPSTPMSLYLAGPQLQSTEQRSTTPVPSALLQVVGRRDQQPCADCSISLKPSVFIHLSTLVNCAPTMQAWDAVACLWPAPSF